MNINYNILFKEINDSVKYKVTIENKGEEDVYINNKGQIGDSSYIVYDYIWDDNQNVIKGKSEKTFELNITYKKTIETSKLTNGSYIEEKNLVIKISDQKGNNLPVKNPNTDSNLSIFIILLSIEILVILGITIYLIKNKKLNIRSIKQMKKANQISAGIFLILVLGTIIGYSYALEVAEIRLNSIVKISKARLARSCISDSYAKEHPYYNIEDRALAPMQERDYYPEIIRDDNDYCLDWNEELLNDIGGPSAATVLTDMPATYYERSRRGPIVNLITVNSKEMPLHYVFEGLTYNIYYSSDVSDLQNGEVILGLYQNTDDYSVLIVIGQDGGVLAPVDSSWLFGSFGYEEYGYGYDSLDLAEIYSTGSSIDYEYIYTKPKMMINSIKPNIMNPMVFVNNIKLDNIDFSDTNNMSGMVAFNGANSEYWRLSGIDSWNTKNVKDMSLMFAGVGINNLSSVDNLNALDTSNVEDMFLMFKMAFRYTPNLSLTNWDTSKVKDMSGMFMGAFQETTRLDISKWNVSNVEDMGWMFLGALNEITAFNISGWDTSNVRNMSCLFMGAFNNLSKLNINNWNVTNVDNMEYMFSNSLQSSEELDLSKWNPKNVLKMRFMFSNTSYYMNIYINNFDFTGLNTYEGIFNGLSNNVRVYVNSPKQKEWIISLQDGDKPSTWTEENIVIV